MGRQLLTGQVRLNGQKIPRVDAVKHPLRLEIISEEKNPKCFYSKKFSTQEKWKSFFVWKNIVTQEILKFFSSKKKRHNISTESPRCSHPNLQSFHNMKIFKGFWTPRTFRQYLLMSWSFFSTGRSTIWYAMAGSFSSNDAPNAVFRSQEHSPPDALHAKPSNYSQNGGENFGMSKTKQIPYRMMKTRGSRGTSRFKKNFFPENKTANFFNFSNSCRAVSTADASVS